jgi:cyclase
MRIAPRGGLHELGDGLFCYLQPDGTWGWSNAGLVTGDGTSLLLDLRIGDRAVHLLEVGPAHTDGDAIVHVPDAGVVFTGDILFVEGTPIVWAGPFSNWLGACDRILALDAPTLVPGHGAVTDASGVHEVKRYLAHARDESKARFDAGMDAEQAADDIDLSDFAGWGDTERIAVNVETAYRELDPSRRQPTRPELFVRMARWASRH